MPFDEQDKLFDAYNTYSQYFQRFFIALCIFALLFFFALFYPYVDILNKKYSITVDDKQLKNATGLLEEIITTFKNAQNRTHAAQTNITYTPKVIQNVSIAKNENKNGGQAINQGDFGQAINLSNNTLGNITAISNNPQIAASGHNVYVAWVERTALKSEIFFTRSTFSGIINQTVSLSNITAISDNPQIAVSGDNVYVVWSGIVDASNRDIYYTRSTDGGATFSPAINLSNNTGDSSDQKIAVSGNNVYVVWKDRSTGNHDIYFKRSTDGGATFDNNAVSLDKVKSSPSNNPQIAVSGNNVYVVWSEDIMRNSEIYYTRSTDGGATFSPAINLSNNTGYSVDPQVAVSGNNVYVVWRDNTNFGTKYDIFFNMSTDGGAKFKPQPDSLTTNALSYDLRIAASNDNVYILWTNLTKADTDILLKTSTNNGSNFGSSINLSNDKGTSTLPQIAITEDNVYIVWNDDSRGNAVEKLQRNGTMAKASVGRTYDVLFKMASNNGKAGGFGEVIDLSSRNGNSVNPQIAASGDNVFVVWGGDSLGHPDIYLKINTGRIQDEVQNRYEDYRQVLKDDVIEPLTELNKKLHVENTNKFLTEIGIDNTRTKVDNILRKALVIDGQLDNLTLVVGERAANNTLIVKNQPSSNNASYTNGTLIQIPSLSVEQDVLARIAEIIENSKTIGTELRRELTELNDTESGYKMNLKALDGNVTQISERLKAVQTPLGSLPVGLKESVPIFPILLTSGFILCAYLLSRTSGLREKFRTTGNPNPDEQVVKLVLPLWIDHLRGNNQVLWFVILLIPLFIFVASWIVLQQSVKITNAFIGE